MLIPLKGIIVINTGRLTRGVDSIFNATGLMRLKGRTLLPAHGDRGKSLCGYTKVSDTDSTILVYIDVGRAS